MPRPQAFSHDVVVIGGCGHVGLPLAIALADSGASVLVYDVSERAVALVNDAVLPFDEPGADVKLKDAVTSGALRASTDPSVVGQAENVVVVIGTPVDEHLNPDPQAIIDLLEERGVKYTTWEGWIKLDAHELALGEEWTAAENADGIVRERVKVVPREHMIEISRG